MISLLFDNKKISKRAVTNRSFGDIIKSLQVDWLSERSFL